MVLGEAKSKAERVADGVPRTGNSLRPARLPNAWVASALLTVPLYLPRQGKWHKEGARKEKGELNPNVSIKLRLETLQLAFTTRNTFDLRIFPCSPVSAWAATQVRSAPRCVASMRLERPSTT
jgi:hypothetical protein